MSSPATRLISHDVMLFLSAFLIKTDWQAQCRHKRFSFNNCIQQHLILMYLILQQELMNIHNHSQDVSSPLTHEKEFKNRQYWSSYSLICCTSDESKTSWIKKKLQSFINIFNLILTIKIYIIGNPIIAMVTEISISISLWKILLVTFIPSLSK